MKKTITVVPLGPGNPELLTVQTVKTLHSAQRIILRTANHPVAAWLDEQNLTWQSLDSFYDAYDNFDEMHQAMADWLWNESSKSPICFCVMTPHTDRAVLALKKARPADADLLFLAGISPLDTCIAAVPEEKNMENAFSVFSAADFLTAIPDPNISLLITELDSPLLAGRVKLHLADTYEDETEIWFFPSSVKKRAKAKKIPLYLMDCQKTFDHTVSVLIPGISFRNRNKYSWHDLSQIVEELRAPNGCPWDRIQSHDSLRPYMVEEAWEVVSAIEEQDSDHLSDELGDVLFQVFFHASIGQSMGEFTMSDVLSKVCSKMILRHPHVFLDSSKVPLEGTTFSWEQVKRLESGKKTVGESLDDVSKSLPSLKYSIKMLKKLAQIPAFRRNAQSIIADIQQLSVQLKEDDPSFSDHMAQLLMRCTELCYNQDQDAEIILHHAMDHLKRRYQKAEKHILADEKSPDTLTFQQLCVYLNSSKEEDE